MDVRELIPRVRRAAEGVVPATSGALSDDQLRDLIADAISEVIFYTGGLWGRTINVTERDGNNVPTEYEIVPDLTLPEETVVAVQAALDYFFHEFKTAKVRESLQNEAVSWEWEKSANLVNAQFEELRSQRDQAIALIEREHPTTVRWASFIAVRDQATSAYLEPYLHGQPYGEMQPYTLHSAISNPELIR